MDVQRFNGIKLNLDSMTPPELDILETLIWTRIDAASSELAALAVHRLSRTIDDVPPQVP